MQPRLLSRRRLLATSLTVLCWPRAFATAAGAAELPAEVGGIRIPRSALARRAADYARMSCPPFLFNHCMRTFVFGALQLERQKRTYRAEDSFVAAALHDLGLLPAFESAHASFEIDGADAAETFMRRQHAAAGAADRVWHAVEMHDGKWALTVRQGPEAMLVALGAAADVDGPDPGLEPRLIDEVVAAFPREQFKRRFTALLIDHCRRKPTSQRGTWLEGLCREQAPQAFADSVEREIAAAPFAE
jgi:hypothetical protein